MNLVSDDPVYDSLVHFSPSSPGIGKQMMMDPVQILEDFGRDPSLMAELAALGGEEALEGKEGRGVGPVQECATPEDNSSDWEEKWKTWECASRGDFRR
jgi:hypothetical protein